MELTRQLAGELATILLERLFVLHQPPARVFELRLDEFVRVLRQHRPVPQVLLDKQRCQTLGHLHDRLRLLAGEADTERIALDDLHVDVAPHPLDDVFHDRGTPLFAVQIEVLDDAFEARAAENLLADRLQTILDARRDRRLHVGLGHALGHDQDQRLRPELVRQLRRHERRRSRDDDARQQHRPPAPAGDGKYLLRSDLFADDHSCPRMSVIR